MSDNRNKDPLEEFFRKKVWDYDISYNEADWMELKDRLDILDRQYARRSRRRWLAAASLLLFCLLGYFTYQNYTNINEISQQLNQETVRQNNRTEITEEDPSPGTPADDRPAADQEKTAIASHASGRESPERQSEGGTEAQPNAGEGDPDAWNMVAAGRTTDRLSVREIDSRERLVSGMDENSEPPMLSHLAVTESYMRAGSPILTASSEPITPVDSQNGPSRQSSPRFAVGLIMSPDISTAGSISDFYDPGYKVGLQVEYSLTRNLGITAGIMQSKVRYRASGSEYSPPQGYWSSGIVPDETIGVCSLIDIPISLKYNFLNLNRSRFFATTGITSYIMQNEDYRFKYGQDYTAGQPQSWSEHTGTRHWLSNANFSIGYEYDLRPNWSLRAEPFVKVPLKEVGWGNVKLYSMGTFVSINYKIH